MSNFAEKFKDVAIHNELGKKGEEEAVRFLINKGYRILHRNWRSGKKELDIVAEYGHELIVIEVKTRRNHLYGSPEEAVNERKIRRIVASADAYIRKFAIDMPVRFDIITLTGKEPPFEIEHIEEAFYPPIW